MARRVSVGLLVMLALAGAGLAIFWDQALDFALDRIVPHTDFGLLETGDLHVVMCGTGVPAPDPTRLPACNAVLAGGEMLMVDAGAGTIRQADVLELPIHDLTTILITHFHSDHMGGLGEAINYSWFRGRQVPITVYGPPGIREVVDGFVAAYAADTRARTLPGGGELDPTLVLPTVRAVEIAGDERVPVFSRNGIRVSAFAVDHTPIRPALGYRVDYRGRSVVFSGDTRRDERLARHARGADLLIHHAIGLTFWVDRAVAIYEEEGQTEWARQLPDGPRLFATPVDAAELAQDAGVAKLVLSHVPPVPWFAEPIFLWGVSDVYDGEVVVARDGQRFDLPAGAD